MTRTWKHSLRMNRGEQRPRPMRDNTCGERLLEHRYELRAKHPSAAGEKCLVLCDGERANRKRIGAGSKECPIDNQAVVAFV